MQDDPDSSMVYPKTASPPSRYYAGWICADHDYPEHTRRIWAQSHEEAALAFCAIVNRADAFRTIVVTPEDGQDPLVPTRSIRVARTFQIDKR